MSESEDSESLFACWAVLELMGHRRLAGYVSEQQVFGVTMLRIDIPGEPEMTQMYAPGAVYCLTPTSEQTARRVATMGRPTPVRPWELPAFEDDEFYDHGS